LDNFTVSITHKVENKTNDTMYFSLGTHPGFLLENELTNYVLEFECEESPFSHQSMTTKDGNRRISKDLLPAPFEDDHKTIKLSNNLFDIGVYVFHQPNSDTISIKNSQTSEAVTVGFKGFPYVGIWSVPGAPFVCIEPWYGVSNVEGYDNSTLPTQPGIQQLQAAATFTCTHSVTLYPFKE
jgi:galactose mutarotase-like enzyme